VSLEEKPKQPKSRYAVTDLYFHDLEANKLNLEPIDRRQGLGIACPEEIACRLGFITAVQLEALAQPIRNSGYGQYLLKLVRGPFLVAARRNR